MESEPLKQYINDNDLEINVHDSSDLNNIEIVHKYINTSDLNNETTSETNIINNVDVYECQNGENSKNSSYLDIQLDNCNLRNDGNNIIDKNESTILSYCNGGIDNEETHDSIAEQDHNDSPNKTYVSTTSSEFTDTIDLGGQLINQNESVSMPQIQTSSADDILKQCKFEYNMQDAFILKDGIRRNSFPENYRNVSNDKKFDSNSISDIIITDEQNLPVINIDSKHGDKKNLSEVVKNMHGLFSYVGGSLKNAYKPMEKNISGIARNFNMAKNDFLRADRGIQDTQKAAESINKYSTLNLCNDNDGIELFKKCESFSDEKISVKQDNNHISHETNNSDLNSIKENQYVKNIDTCIAKSVRDISDINNVEQSNVDLISPENAKAQINPDDINSKERVISNTEIDDDVDRVAVLEACVTELNKELFVLKMALIDKDAIKKNLESKMNFFMKQLETVTAERDASVVRYAMSERSALEAIKSKDAALSAEQTARRETTMITQRLRTANAEKTRATAAFDMKNHEISVSQKEIAKLKDELQSCEVKLKWAQSKLVSEMGAHKESSALVEKLSYQMKQVEGGNGTSAPTSQSQSDMESLLREKEANIILEKHEKERFMARCKQLQAENDKLKALAISDDVRELKAQIQSSAAEADALRRACSELRDQGAKDCERLAAAQARAARCDTLTLHLQQEQDRYAKLTQELESVRLLREEALAESELRIRREAELLRQSERLTVVGVKLQATCSEAEAKALALTVDNTSLREAASRAASEAAEARAEAAREREGRSADARALASRAAQHARGEREAQTLLEAARGDIRVLSTKHSSALKELKRELHQMKKKCERYESEGKMAPQPITKLSSGSTSSLSSYESQNHHLSDGIENSHDIQSNAPDRQQLVERIVSLQRAAARRGEKLDFLEEHNRQLTQELQRKTRLLRNYLVATPARGLTSPASDAAKAEIGRHGGVMSSVYGSQVTDETMTLELSLEINAKLQSLLEDTLLSNITLKENMDTLGDEIVLLRKGQKAGKSHK